MRKFNDILNEEYEGELNNEKAVELIAADFKFIKNVLLDKVVRDAMNKPIVKNGIDTIMEDSFSSTVYKDYDGSYKLKYLGVIFRIDDAVLKNEGLDVGTYFTEMRESLKEVFKLKDDKITLDNSWYMKFQLDYQAFMTSDFFKSLKGMDKYNL